MKKWIFGLGFLLAVLAGTAFAQCDLPAEFEHAAVVTDGNFRITVGTLRADYRQGDVIEFQVVTTNTGAAAETLQWPVEYPDALIVTDPACDDIRETIGSWLFRYPPFLFYVPGSETLAPGECRVRTMAWDTAADPVDPGVYRVWGGLVAWPVESIFEPGWGWILDPAILEITIDEAVSRDEVTWGQIKARYSN